MRLYSMGDVASALGVSRQRAYELWQHGQLPPPLGFTSGGAIWLADGIDRYAADRNRNPGRPRRRQVAPC